jgi:hypothetical protein
VPARPPLLERIGIAYLRRRAQGAGEARGDDDVVHVLTDDEQRSLRRIERAVVTKAALAGALSALASGLAEHWATARFGESPESFDFGYLWRYWGVVGGVTAVAAVLEILFLYRDALDGVHRLSHAAGLRLFDASADPRATVAGALARAALELPNPLESDYRLDPHREVSRVRLLAATLLYKAKVGLTSFLLKLVLRRVLTRAALRVWLVFVSVPVTALWNAIVAFRVIREARIRAMGPSAAQDLTERLFARCPALSTDGARAALRAVGACVVSSFDLHPNHAAMLDSVRARTGDPGEVDLGDREAFLADLRLLTEGEQQLVLGVLGVAAVLDGRLTRNEKLLFAQARRAVGLPVDDAALHALRRAFVTGRPVDDAVLAALGSR